MVCSLADGSGGALPTVRSALTYRGAGALSILSAVVIRLFAMLVARMVCEAMPASVLPLIEAAAHWPERGALVGLDLGTKTIGVAVSDPDRRLATGVETIQRKTFTVDAARLLAIADERNAAGFVLGLPINMDGSEGPRAQSTRAFARNLAKLTDLAIGLWDERLSTVAVERELIGMDMSRAKRAKVIDEHAAIFILQGALDRLATQQRGSSGRD
jgi:putative holliday junction resolvase